MRKLAVPVILTFILSIPMVMWVQRFPFTPMQAGLESVAVDDLLRLEFGIAGVIFVLIMVFFVYNLIAFRRRPGDMGEGEHFHSHTGLEVAWTVVPAIIVLWLGVHGIQVWDKLQTNYTAKQAGDLHVKVVAQQWAWSFEYPDQGITSSELVLPANKTVFFELNSVDVEHAFFIPEMRFKMDNVPGKTNVLRLTPNRLGEYKVRCAELCGTNHAYMQAAVRIVKDDAYAKWITDQAAIFKAPPAERGAAWAKQYGCTACHSIDGSKKVGPTWKGLAGSSVELADGTTDMADDEYLRNSILKPQSQIVEGYGENVMPRNFRERITDKQIDDLISYIKTLK